MEDIKAELSGMTSCPVCFEESEDVRLLPCHHSFSCDCINQLIASSNITPTKDSVVCPNCRQIVQIFDGEASNLPPSFFVNTLRDVINGNSTPLSIVAADSIIHKCSYKKCGYTAEKYCKNCKKFLCPRHITAHDELFDDDDDEHELVLPAEHNDVLAEKLALPYCKRHTEHKLELYCLTCSLPMCNTCANTAHHKHERCEIEEQAGKCRLRLQNLVQRASCILHCLAAAHSFTENSQKHAKYVIESMIETIKTTKYGAVSRTRILGDITQG